MAEMDFEKASGNELYEWWTLHPSFYGEESFAALRDRIVAQVEARLRAETVDREREAAREAWQAGYITGLGGPEGSIITGSLPALEARDSYLAREYPAPAPKSVTPETVRPQSPVVAAFVAPDNAMWQGRCVNVCADGSWWSSLDGNTWQPELPAFAATVEGR